MLGYIFITSNQSSALEVKLRSV